MLRKMVVFFLVGALSLLNPAELSANNTYERSLSIENQAQFKMGLSTQMVCDVLDEYFEYRNSLFSTFSTKEPSVIEISETVLADAQKRYLALQRLQSSSGKVFREVQTGYKNLVIKTDSEGKNTNLLTVIEQVEIYYQTPGYDGIDNTGYEVEHEICLGYDPTQEKPIVISDEFYEMVLEVKSSGYVSRDENGIAVLSQQSSYPTPNRTTFAYNASAAVSYAETWWNGHNPTYYTATSDCANFVSQCLREGGIPFINQNSTSGWYADAWGGTSAWESVASAETFWQTQGIYKGLVYADGSLTYNKCIPGNPIYWKNQQGSQYSGHLMILTGYTSTGEPVVCAHNSNVHDMPISFLENDHNTLYVLDFAHNYNVFINYGNSTYHKKKCSICNDTAYELHTWVLASKKIDDQDERNVIYQCVYCGATMNGGIREGGGGD